MLRQTTQSKLEAGSRDLPSMLDHWSRPVLGRTRVENLDCIYCEEFLRGFDLLNSLNYFRIILVFGNIPQCLYEGSFTFI